MKIEDIFVSGTHEGKIRFMFNDRHEPIKEAFPGEAVHIGGFKQFPDVGSPLYVVENLDEAKFILSRIQMRAERLAQEKLSNSGRI